LPPYEWVNTILGALAVKVAKTRPQIAELEELLSELWLLLIELSLLELLLLELFELEDLEL
jgi:hypothetical protein